ncbi:cyclin like F box protein [Trypanosoma vivax]|nr:cyclin like F box protein [Trypanosoma vivax]
MRVQMGRVPEEDGAGDAQSGTAPCAEGRAKEVSPGPAAFSRGSSPAFSPGLSSLVPSSVRSKAPRGHGQLPEHVPFGGCAAPASGAQVCDGPLMVKLQAPAGACARHSTRPLDELSRDELMGESSASTGSDVPGDSGEDGAAVRLPATATAAGGGRVSSLHGLPDAVLLGIVPYLCLPEVLALLTVTRKLNRLVRQYFAVNSHGVLSIPAFDSRSFLQYRPDRKPQAQASTSDAPARKLPGVKPIRLFFGQQRRDAHPSALRRLLRFIAPSLPIMHMEAHVNPVTGRGKGCVWATVPSLAEAKRLMALNKRLFLDVNSDGEEVYMFAPPSAVEWLRGHAELAAASTSRPSHLPRQPMIVGAPRKGPPGTRKILEEYAHLQERGFLPTSSSALLDSTHTGDLTLPSCSANASHDQAPWTMDREAVDAQVLSHVVAWYCGWHDYPDWFRGYPLQAYDASSGVVWLGPDRYHRDPYMYKPLAPMVDEMDLLSADPQCYEIGDYSALQDATVEGVERQCERHVLCSSNAPWPVREQWSHPRCVVRGQ